MTLGQHHGVMPGELPYLVRMAALRKLVPTLAAISSIPAPRSFASTSEQNNIAHSDDASREGTERKDIARLVGWLASDEAT